MLVPFMALAVQPLLYIRFCSERQTESFVSHSKYRHYRPEEFCLLVSSFVLCGLVITFS